MKRTTRRMMSNHQRGNVRTDANCTTVKRGVRSRSRLVLPGRKSWRLCYDGGEWKRILFCHDERGLWLSESRGL